MLRANRWNRFIYALWAPFYDFLVGAPPLAKARARAMEKIALKPGERVCLVGVGTGADFAFLPEGVTAVGIDLSRQMLAKARKKLPVRGCDISLEQAKAEDLPFPDDSFDVAILTLIVSVAGDGAVCMREAVRVVRAGGRVLVFDKFLPPGSQPSLLRLLHRFTRFFGTDINRSFDAVIAGLPVRIISNQPALLRGAYRAILLEKKATGP